ncbi:hypothetical protein [Paraburkholderia dioscoreae]|uniref:Uncharacterized protein n=1 Tax=Paraburkholderia dioscoreae TaxID=2604047 RepID=A0A5Q4ZPE6_9BURK|nr:hypothetical protein [Paraburkholderia dioscoreae]VVD32638.1 conserved protein of unknown function [Paraburkholderia dioscoreae]
MNRLLEFDLQARTELLAYLVASQLVLRQRTGHWLRPEQLVESTRLWLRLNGRRADWLQRVTLACRAQRLAEQLERSSRETCDARSLARMFFGGVRLDLGSRAVMEIFVACVANLPGEIVFRKQGG